MGTGDIRPKTADEYALNLPEEAKGLADALASDAQFAEFKKAAHELGFTQKQMDLVMGRYAELAPALVQGAVALDEQAATAELQKVWTTPDAFKANAQAAYRAVAQIGGDLSERLEQKFGNDPDFIQFAARVGAQLREDSPPRGAGEGTGAPSDVRTLMASEAYTNPRHPEHAAVTARVNAHFARQPGASQPL